MARTPPAGLTARTFSLRQAAVLGYDRDEVRRWGLVAPTRSVRAGAVPVTVAQRAAAFALALPPDAAFSHVTAARLWHLPLPEQASAPDTAPEDLDVMRPSNRGLVRRRGCRGHRGLESRRVEAVDGLRVTSMPDSWVDLGALHPATMTTEDLVVLGDAVLSRVARGAGRAPDACDIDVLRRALERRTAPRGRVALLAALDLVRAGSRSPMETRTRLMFRAAGFPEPELNAAVHDGGGGWLLEGDLVWRAQRVVVEYQGKDHADLGRRSADAQRRGLAEDAGWTVIEAFAADVLRAPRRRTLLERVARALGIDPGRLHIG